MKIVIAEDGVHLVVEGVVGTQAIEHTAIGHVDIGEGLQRQRVVQQVLRDAEGREACISVLAQRYVLMRILRRERPVVAGIPVETYKGIRRCRTCSPTLQLVQILSHLTSHHALTHRHRHVAAQHRHATILAPTVADDGLLVPRMQGRQREVDAAEEERQPPTILHIAETTLGFTADGNRSH